VKSNNDNKKGIHHYSQGITSLGDCDLIVIGNVFPHPMSGFSYAENLAILDKIPNSHVIATGKSLHLIGTDSIDKLILDFFREHPNNADKLWRFSEILTANAKLLYCIFLSEAYNFLLPMAEKYKIPFVFTLYPGGEFKFNREDSDNMLSSVCKSKYFRKVIVTQRAIYNYLLEKGFCEEEHIEYIFGVVTPPEKLLVEANNKKHYGYDKDTLDICFVAHKYSDVGYEKGYDLFIETAKKLSAAYDNLHFHIVGAWTEDTIDISGVKNIHFYGTRSQDWFDKFYSDKDIILSPNRMLTTGHYKGACDGFPTGATTDAMLRKVAAFGSDVLSSSNGLFSDGEDFVFIDCDVESIVHKIEYYFNHPSELKSIGEEGQKKARDVYSYESQIEPRLKILTSELHGKPYREAGVSWDSLVDSLRSARATEQLDSVLADYKQLVVIHYLQTLELRDRLKSQCDEQEQQITDLTMQVSNHAVLQQHCNNLEFQYDDLMQHCGNLELHRDDLAQQIFNLTQHVHNLSQHVRSLEQHNHNLMHTVSYRITQRLMANRLFRALFSLVKKAYRAVKPAKKKARAKKAKITPGQIIPIMHCFDNNYVIPAAASFHSMLTHANPSFVYKLYVLHSDITWQNQKKLTELVERFPNASLEFIDMSHRFDDVWKNFVNVGHLAKEVLYKLITPTIFNNYDKLIVTDVDVIFERDISPSFFEFSTSDNIYLAGVKHIQPVGSWLDGYYDNYDKTFGPGMQSELKICGGYLVLNLHKLREDNMENIFLDFLDMNAHKLLQAEQDVFNYCLDSRNILNLPLNYVLCSYAYDLFPTTASYNSDRHYTSDEIRNSLQNPIQLHYASSPKPWDDPNSTKADKWYSALKQTRFYDDFILKKQSSGGFPLEPAFIWPDYSEPEFPVMVSVLCCTYNHIKFIENTLKYIVNQKTDYTFEIIVADDASFDGTQQVIKEYISKYPHLFKKCLLRDENVGIGQNYYEALQLAEGKYLAICDGDDYWIHPNKLQMQVDFLEKYSDFSIVCSSFNKHYVGLNKDDEIFYVDAHIEGAWNLKEKYEFRDLLYCRFIASCTVMMRWKLHNRVPEFIKNYSIIDFQLTLIHSAFGGIFVLNDDVLAQYNSSEGGLFRSNEKTMAKETQMIIREVNQYLRFNFDESIVAYLKSI